MYLSKNHSNLLKILLLGVIFCCQIFAQPFGKEIFPFTENNIALTQFTQMELSENSIFGIGYYFNSQGEKILSSSFLAVFRLNDDFEYEKHWHYSLPNNAAGDFTDFILSDFDNDGQSEVLVTATNYNKQKPFHSLLLFEQGKGGLILMDHLKNQSDLKGLKLSKILSLGQHNNKTNFLLLDNSDQQKIIKMTLRKEILTFQNIWQQKQEEFFVSQLLKKNETPFLLGANSDQLSLINLTTLDEQKIFEPSGNVWDINNTAVGDFNGDSKEEIIIGLMNGGINMLKEESDSVQAVSLLNPSVKFDKIFVLDMDYDGKDDLILVGSKGNYVKKYSYNMSADKIWQSTVITTTEMEGIHIMDIDLAEGSSDLYFSYLYPDFSYHGIFQVTNNFEETSPFHQFNREDQQHRVLNPMAKIDSLLAITKFINGRTEAITRPATDDIQVVGKKPDTKSPDFTILPGDFFSRSVDLYAVDREKINYTLNAPAGFRFDLASRKFLWQPDKSQLGYHHIEANFYWDDVKIKKEFSIYVNDKIKITNKLSPTNIIQQGEIFTYKISTDDQNSDSHVRYTMSMFPDGAIINSAGLLKWNPNKSQSDWYDFKLSVSDGFSTDHLSFSLFVNHPVKIVPSQQININTSEQLNYPIKLYDKNNGFYLSQYKRSPKITNYKQSGIYESLILSSGTKKILPNKIRQLRTIQRPDFSIETVLFENNKLILFFTWENKKPSFSKVFSTFFTFINESIPNHTSFVEPQFYQYNIKRAPENAYITKSGILKWNPGMEALGLHHIAFTISDGYYSDEYSLPVFVNSMPEILSQPPKYAKANKKYQYKITVSDQNPEQTITYFLDQSPPNATLSSTGLLEWVARKNSAKFSIGVTDQIDTTYQQFTIKINQKPQIQARKKIVTKINKYLEYKITAKDPEGDPIHFKAMNIPETANFDTQKGTLVWKPTKEDLGEHHIKIKVIDRQGNFSYKEFAIIVTKSTLKWKLLAVLSGIFGIGTLIYLFL